MHLVQGRALVGGRPPEAEAFLLQSVPKTQSPGTLAFNHVYFLYSNNNIPKTDPRLKKKWVGSAYEALCTHHDLSN